MQQIPGLRTTLEDKRELQRNIKDLEKKVNEACENWPKDKPLTPEMNDMIKQLRELRRIRT